MGFAIITPLLLVVACGNDDKPTDTSLPEDTSTDQDSQANQDTDHVDTGPDTGDTQQEPSSSTSLSWRLHDDIPSMVYVTWWQLSKADVHVEYSFDPGEWLSTPTFQAYKGTNQQILLGIPFETEVQWRIVPETDQPVDGELITTGDFPSGMPTAELLEADPESWLQTGNYLLCSINEQTGGWTQGSYWTFFMDRKGRIVWAHEAPDKHWTLFAQVSVTGRYFLWDEATYWAIWDSGAASTVHRWYMDSAIDEISTPGLHHTFVQLPDESLVWGSQYNVDGESLVEKALGSDQETVIWNSDKDWTNRGHIESNGLFYNVSTDTFLYSFYTNNSLVELDHATGETLWWAGQVSGGYDFDPTDSQFSWQHGVSFTDAGTLLLSTAAHSGGNVTTMVREYEVDHQDETLHEIWNYDPGIHASTNGDAWRLENGNTLHVIGSSGHIVEVDPDGNFVWHVTFNATRLLGRGEFIEDLYDLVPNQGHSTP